MMIYPIKKWFDGKKLDSSSSETAVALKNIPAKKELKKLAHSTFVA